MSAAIETKNLRKEYGGAVGRPAFTAVQDLSLSVPRGQVFGLLGPNGAGKTTTINMLLGNIKPTSGEAFLLGQPVGNQEARAHLGFLPEKFQFHEFLSAEEFLDLHGRLYGMSKAARKRRIPEVLEQVGLIARRKSRLSEFSKGMQQHVGLAQAILNDPDLVILDELNIVLRYDYLPLDEVVVGLQARPAMKHVVITGRNAPDALVAVADLVTSMEQVKHPYRDGVKAQRGIEF